MTTKSSAIPRRCETALVVLVWTVFCSQASFAQNAEKVLLEYKPWDRERTYIIVWRRIESQVVKEKDKQFSNTIREVESFQIEQCTLCKDTGGLLKTSWLDFPVKLDMARARSSMTAALLRSGRPVMDYSGFAIEGPDEAQSARLSGEGPMGVKGKPFPRMWLNASRGFPWLPQKPVAVGQEWEDKLQTAYMLGVKVFYVPLFDVTVQSRLENVEQIRSRHRTCAKITSRFSGEAELEEDAGTLRVSGSCTRLFDIENGCDVEFRKHVIHDVSKMMPEGKGIERTEHFVTFVLSENDFEYKPPTPESRGEKTGGEDAGKRKKQRPSTPARN